MSESILNSVKKLLGLMEDYNAFDSDIILNINMALNILTQLGIGPVSGFTITDENQTWSDFFGEDRRIEMAKIYVFLKVKTVFDPPQSSVVMECYKEQIKELEWRLKEQEDKTRPFDKEVIPDGG